VKQSTIEVKLYDYFYNYEQEYQSLHSWVKQIANLIAAMTNIIRQALIIIPIATFWGLYGYNNLYMGKPFTVDLTLIDVAGAMGLPVLSGLLTISLGLCWVCRLQPYGFKNIFKEQAHLKAQSKIEFALNAALEALIAHNNIDLVEAFRVCGYGDDKSDFLKTLARVSTLIKH